MNFCKKNGAGICNLHKGVGGRSGAMSCQGQAGLCLPGGEGDRGSKEVGTGWSGQYRELVRATVA